MDSTSKTVLWRRTCGRRLSYPTNRTPTQPTVSRPALTLHHREEREEERAQNAIFEQEVRDRRSWNLSPSSSSPTVNRLHPSQLPLPQPNAFASVSTKLIRV